MTFSPLTFFLVSPTALRSPCLFPPSSPFPKWCERNEQCRRLQLRDLLVAPLQRLTRYPLLLRNIAKRCPREDEAAGLQVITEQVDTSICENPDRPVIHQTHHYKLRIYT